MNADIEIMLLGLFLLLQVADYWTTMRILKQGGHENNRVVAWIMQRLGVVAGLMLVKVFVMGVVAVVIYYLGGDYALPLLGAGCVLYAWIVLDNYRQIK